MKPRNVLIPAALLLAAGCASFNSGDVVVSRNHLRSMLEARDIRPAAEIRLSWKNFPYKSGIETIGEGTAIPVKPRPVPVPIGDTAWLKKRVEAIFAETGLYDAQKGSGTLSISLTSYGSWTYKEIFRSFLVDTGYIFIIPATLRVNHQLVVEYNGADGRAGVEEVGQNKTTFHALLFPLYPLFTPGRKEHSLLKNMLWKSTVDLYLKVKRGAGSPAGKEGTPAKAEDVQGIKPDKPDATWVVPTTQAETVQPAQEIKPEPADRDWIVPGASTESTTPDD